MSLSEWQAHLRRYHEQLRLEQYQQNRILPRPKTTKVTVAVYVLLLLLVLVGSCLLIGILPLYMWLKILACMCLVVLTMEFCGRLVAIKIVECYQHYASEATRRKCKCVPSCSEYAILCLKKYELVYALKRIRKRLYVTCQGFEYILDEP